MTTEKYNVLINCVYYNEDRKLYFIKDDTAQDIKDIVLNAIHDTDEPFDLAYEIANSALNALSDTELAELPDYNAYKDNYDGFASIYTGDRLAYLNNGNQQEISDLMKDRGARSSYDIATACAYWFDQKVCEFIENIKSQICE